MLYVYLECYLQNSLEHIFQRDCYGVLDPQVFVYNWHIGNGCLELTRF